MNDRNSLPPDDAGPPGEAGTPLSASRRRFARAAAPVVLGSLVSTPVLGQGYICTLSGFASGNMSSHTTDVVTCAAGYTPRYWALASSWPYPFIKGTTPDASCVWVDSTIKGTEFNGYMPGDDSKLASVFYLKANTKSNTPKCQVVESDNSLGAASMLQVLNTTSTGDIKELARETIAALLNAASSSLNYPLSQGEIISIFNEVNTTNGYHVDGANMDLTLAGVIKYFQKLNAL